MVFYTTFNNISVILWQLYHKDQFVCAVVFFVSKTNETSSSNKLKCFQPTSVFIFANPPPKPVICICGLQSESKPSMQKSMQTLFFSLIIFFKDFRYSFLYSKLNNFDGIN
jgi:hypothetical protein